MGKSILYIAVSLDGFVAGKDDDLSWLNPYNDVDYGYEGFFSSIGAIIVGRRTYDIEVAHGWENAHPVPTFVMTSRMPDRKPQRPDIVFTDEDIAEVLRKAKLLTHKDVWIEGGAHLARQFLTRGLIDEIVLSVVPVILGDGIPLFDKIGGRISLSLRDVKRFDKGLVQLLYDVSKKNSA
jgi:dihydrofolate reductase